VERAGSALPVCFGHDLGHQLFRIQVQQVAQSGCKGPLLQHHARLFWRLVVLDAIAPLAAGNQVRPGIATASGFGHDVVQGQVVRSSLPRQ